MSGESRIPGDLEDTRTTYDRVAAEYTARVAGELAGKPLGRALLACFAEEVHELGTVADIGCGPGHVTAYLHGLGVPMIGTPAGHSSLASWCGLRGQEDGSNRSRAL